MRMGLLGGVLTGALLAGMVIENSTPGSTKPAAERTSDAAANWMTTLGDMASTAVHTVIPVAADAVDTARNEFPNVLGPPTSTSDGTAQHPPVP